MGNDNGTSGMTIIGPTSFGFERDERIRFLERRRGFLGSSDAPPLLGEGYNTVWDVWDSKVLAFKPEVGEPAGDIRRGNKQEANARRRFVEQYEVEVAIPTEPAIHPASPHIGANADGLILQVPEVWKDLELEGHGTLELKAPRVAGHYKRKAEGLLPEDVIQCMHQMLATGHRWAAYAIYTAEYDEVFAFPVLRDDEFCDRLKRLEDRFWAKHVEARVRPPLPQGSVTVPEVPGEAVAIDTDEWRAYARELVLCEYELGLLVMQQEVLQTKLIELAGKQNVFGSGVAVTEKLKKGRRSYDRAAYFAALEMAWEGDDDGAVGPLIENPLDERFFKKGDDSTKHEVLVTDHEPIEVTHA